MNLLEKAIDLAVRSHSGQVDEDGMPHIIHCFEVFRRVQEMFDSGPQHLVSKPSHYTVEELLIAAILHDTVEDTSVTLDQIEQNFGKNVREIVDSVTRRTTKGEYSHAPETKEFYRDFIYRAKENEGGTIVKIADLMHNLSRVPKIKKASWKDKLQFKYSIALRVLNGADQPTWEQASYFVQYDNTLTGTPHYFIADPNGKKIEISEAEFKTLTKKA
jgi:GTP diphosphokinase / guanosine-3',5'-bis(diphosphate) 3'-diphosphatase